MKETSFCKSVSVVVPVYCSESMLTILYKRIVGALNEITETYEIIFVDDCSNDGSWGVICNLSSSDQRVKGIKLGQNVGQHNALLSGILNSNCDIIVTLDDDLQNPPEFIPNLIHVLNNGFDVVYGVPVKREHGVLRNTFSVYVKFILRVTLNYKSVEISSSFRAFRSTMKRVLMAYRGSSANIEALLTWGTANFGHVYVRQDVRYEGKSGYGFKKLFKHTLSMLMGYSTLPLRVASILGISFGIFGLILLLYVISARIIGGAVVPGFAFIAALVSLFSGAQLFCLGIMGEYISKIYSRSMGAPPYNITEKTF